MLVRIRCKGGNFRFELQPTADISELTQKIVESVNADPTTITISNQPRGGETNVTTLNGRSLESLGITHGMLLFVGYNTQEEQGLSGAGSSSQEPNKLPGTSHAPRPWEQVIEDPVDVYWRKRDGKIPRGRDSRFCKHGPNAMCDYCMPLEPYDAEYHKNNVIKHLSYHAYLNKLVPNKSTTPASSLAGALPPLEPLSYKVKKPCPNGKHAPWPEGICTACQPSAITLKPQPFRMVDYLEFSTHDMVDRFLQAWRRTGTQRFGWLIGHYEPYDRVPMGIKAVVEAIHEPPQEGELDGLTLGLPWEDEKNIRDLAASASPPLSIVGYIFTDLDPSDEDRTKNIYKRHPESYFLSSLEVIFAASLQIQNPTPSRSSKTGSFCSRLVTAVATATEDGDVDIAAYQVSEQACAMVEADMIEASVDPGIVRIKEETRNGVDSRYIPDVFFKYKNEYDLDVQKSAKPCFPVEYLLVTVTHGFPESESPLFLSNKFAIENRPGLEDQDIQKVLKDLSKLEAPEVTENPEYQRKEPDKWRKVVEYLSDWHLVAFMPSTHLFSESDVKLLIRASSSAGLSDPKPFAELFASAGWQTLMAFVRENASTQRPQPTASISSNFDDELPQDVRDQIARMEAEEAAAAGRDAGGDHIMAEPGDAGPAVGGNIRICPHCTFENAHGGSDCEVCGLPLT